MGDSIDARRYRLIRDYVSPYYLIEKGFHDLGNIIGIEKIADRIDKMVDMKMRDKEMNDSSMFGKYLEQETGIIHYAYISSSDDECLCGLEKDVMEEHAFDWDVGFKHGYCHACVTLKTRLDDA